MMAEEHGLSAMPRSPWRAAATTFVAFMLIGAIPLLAFTGVVAGIDVPTPFACSAALTAAAFFAVGAMKSRFVDQRWWLAGMETLSVGGVAAILAYAAGAMLKGMA